MMTKKIIAILLAALLLTGCNVAKVENTTKKPEPVNVSRFVQVENTITWEIVADRETGVMYAVSTGAYNGGTFTLLVDADGKPLIYKGE